MQGGSGPRPPPLGGLADLRRQTGASGRDGADSSSPRERIELPSIGEMRKFNEDVSRLKTRFNKQLHKKRSQATQLVTSLESALETFQVELEGIKKLFPNSDAAGKDCERRRRTVARVTAISPGSGPSKGVRDLLQAASSGELELCKAILDREELSIADINTVDEKGMTAMHHLVKFIDEESDGSYEPEQRLEILPKVLEQMINCGANVNLPDKLGRTVFWTVCFENEADLVKVIVSTERPQITPEPGVDAGLAEMALMANPNQSMRVAVNSDGSAAVSARDAPGSSAMELHTLWHIAIEKGQLSMLEALVLAQFKLEVKCHELVSQQADAESAAEAQAEQHAAGRKLTKHGKSKDGQKCAQRRAPRHFPDLNGPWEEVYLAGDPGAWTKQTNCRGNTAWAKDGSPVHVALRLARHEVDARNMLDLLLHELPITQDADKFMTLFDPNALDQDGCTTLHLACSFGYERCIEKLLQYRHHYNGHREAVADINRQEYTKRFTPLMCAITNGHNGAVKELFERNNLMSHASRSSRGDAPAAKRDHDLSLRSSVSQQTPLHLACAQAVEMDDVVLKLCKNKAEVNLKDEFGFSALHLASMHGHVMIVKCLLKYNANAAALENFGKETALHIAAAFGHINILNVLLRKGGAEVHAENREGRTALHHAFQRHSYLSYLVETRLAACEADEAHNPGIADQVENYLKVIERRKERAKRHRLRQTSAMVSPKMSYMLDADKPLFLFDRHPMSPHRELYKKIGLDLELLFLAINNQNMLIKLLLDAGGDLEHEDKQGDPAFITAARFDWFDIHEEEMTEIYDHPNEMGYDSEIFTDKRTQVAVRTRWIANGRRTTALQSLLNWVVFLALLTLVAIRYSGRNSYEAFSMQAGIADRISGDEWDEFDIKMLHEVGNLNDWHQYLANALVPTLWEDDAVYRPAGSNASAEPVATSRGALVNGHLALLGRPRYRQLRTRPDSCIGANPSLLEQTEDTCFSPATTRVYGRPSDAVEDRESFTCPLSNGTMLEIAWKDHSSYAIMGTFGYYKGGGFSVTLPSNASEAASLFNDLEQCRFVALNTRVAMVEFTLYSRSQQLFTHGSVFLELSTAGGINSGSRLETRKLVSYSTEDDYMDLIAEALLGLAILAYFFTEAVQMREPWGEEHIKKKNTPMWWWFELRENDDANRELMENPKEIRIIMSLASRSLCMYKTNRYIPPYWVNVFNYVDVLIMSLVVALVSVHAVLTTQADTRLANWYALSVSEEYVDISDLLWLAVVRQHLLAVLVLLCYIKSLEFLQVTAALAIPVIIIGGMLYQLLSFFLIFAVFILAFALFDFLLYGLAYEPTSSVLRSIIFTFRAALGDLDFDGKFDLDRTFAVLMTCLSAFLLVILLLNLLIAVMNEAFEEIKGQAEARWCYMQFRMIVQHSRNQESMKKISHDIKAGADVLNKPAKKMIDRTISLATETVHQADSGVNGLVSTFALGMSPPAAYPQSDSFFKDHDGVAQHSPSHYHVGDQGAQARDDTYRSGNVLMPQLDQRRLARGEQFSAWLGERRSGGPRSQGSSTPSRAQIVPE